jgi:DNA-binding HxlR family transcriptional regulator
LPVTSAADARARRSYAQFCPLARALDILGERWTLLVVRELLLGPQRFSDLRTHLPGIAPALLTQRLRDLEAADLVRRAELPPPAARTVYELTERGRALDAVIYELARFGLPYLDMPSEEQPLAPHLLPHGLKTLVAAEALPRRAFVAHLVFDEGDFVMRVAAPRPGPPIARVTVERGVPERADVTIRGSAAIVLWVRRRLLSFEEARSQGLLDLEGDERAVDAARAMLGFS